MKKPYTAALIISGALILGVLAYKVSGINDSPVEQLAEHVLSGYGVDIDFSPGV